MSFNHWLSISPNLPWYQWKIARDAEIQITAIVPRNRPIFIFHFHSLACLNFRDRNVLLSHKAYGLILGENNFLQPWQQQYKCISNKNHESAILQQPHLTLPSIHYHSEIEHRICITTNSFRLKCISLLFKP